MAGNQYKQFRGVNQAIEGNLLTKRYDEPTYLTFRAVFGEDFATWSGVTLLNTDYDKMPHPLFNPIGVDAERVTGDSRSAVEFNRDFYSTIDYLRDSNEFSRAEMLIEFIRMWNDLQKNFQYYFRSVEGVGDLLRPAPLRGKRVADDFRLTFNMAEGIDQRVSYLLNLYRKIAWDDIYQRWVLPDMMRFFSIRLYITEFRTFHQSSIQAEAEGPSYNQTQNIYNYGGDGTSWSRLKEQLGLEQLRKTFGSGYTPNNLDPIYLIVLNNILPTHVIECQMCEFDIESFNFNYRDNLSIDGDPAEATVSFQVKVGNINEVQTFPLFQHYIFNDYKINGLDRSKEKGNTKNLLGRISSDQNDAPFSVTKLGDARYSNLSQIAQDLYSQSDMHEAGGVPWVQSGESNNLKNAGPNAALDSAKIDPIEPATWVDNALKFGESFAVNFVAENADKLKMTKIPGLGFSFNEAVNAVESKSFTSILALIRRGIDEYVGGTEPPSSQLSGIEETLTDKAFREFLRVVTQSDATDDDKRDLLREILRGGEKWKKIKDLSLATDLVGPGEATIPVKIEGGNQYSQAVLQQARNDRSTATDLDGGPNFYMTGNFVGNQTSSDATTTNAKDLEGKYLQPGDRSGATDLDGGPIFINPDQIITAAPSSATSSRKIQTDKSFVGVSEGLGNSIQTGGPTSSIKSEATDGDTIAKGDIVGTGGLGNSIEGGNFSGDGGLGNSVDGGNFTGSGGLGNDVEGGNFSGDGGLGNNVDGGKLVGAGELGNTIDSDYSTINKLSEATDGDAVENILPQPNPSKATNNKIE